MLQEIRPAAACLFQSLSVATRCHAEKLARRLGTYAFGKRGDAFERDKVHRVDRQPDEGQHVLDMRGLGIAQPAVFAEGDAPLVQLQFQMVRLVTGPEQHGYLIGRHAAQQFLDAPRHDLCLGEVAQGAVQRDCCAAGHGPPGEKALPVPFA